MLRMLLNDPLFKQLGDPVIQMASQVAEGNRRIAAQEAWVRELEPVVQFMVPQRRPAEGSKGAAGAAKGWLVITTLHAVLKRKVNGGLARAQLGSLNKQSNLYLFIWLADESSDPG